MSMLVGCDCVDRRVDCESVLLGGGCDDRTSITDLY